MKPWQADGGQLRPMFGSVAGPPAELDLLPSCRSVRLSSLWMLWVGPLPRLPEFSVPSGSQQAKRLQPAQSMHTQPQPVAPQMPPSPVQSQQSQQPAASGAASGARTVAVAILKLHTVPLLTTTASKSRNRRYCTQMTSSYPLPTHLPSLRLRYPLKVCRPKSKVISQPQFFRGWVLGNEVSKTEKG